MAKKKNVNRQELMTEIATVSRDPYAVIYGGNTLRSQDDTLLQRGGGKGLKLYDEIERDCHAYAVLQKRKMAVIAREWMVDPASDSPLDVKAGEVVKDQLTNLGFDNLCLGLLDSILKGYAVSEPIWEIQGDQLVVKCCKSRDQRRFTFTVDGDMRLLTRENMLDGEALPERKFIVHRFGAKDGNPFGLGEGNRLFWAVFFKRQGLSFWLTFADKYGSPTPVGKYRPGTPKPDQDKLLRALRALQQEYGVVIPDDMQISFLEAAKGVTAEFYGALCRYMDEQISEAVLGETLSTNIGSSGSLAAGQVHNEVRQELTKADADLLSSTLNETLVTWITELNVPGAKPPKVWRVFPKDLKSQMELDKGIYSLGYRPTPDYIEQTYGPGWVPASGQGAAFAENPADPAERYAGPAGAAAGHAMGGIVAPIFKLVQEATSLEEIRDKLLGLYPNMDAQRFGLLMQEAMLAAELAGRYEVLGGA